jgi:hypothetical protein
MMPKPTSVAAAVFRNSVSKQGRRSGSAHRATGAGGAASGGTRTPPAEGRRGRSVAGSAAARTFPVGLRALCQQPLAVDRELLQLREGARQRHFCQDRARRTTRRGCSAPPARADAWALSRPQPVSGRRCKAAAGSPCARARGVATHRLGYVLDVIHYAKVGGEGAAVGGCRAGSSGVGVAKVAAGSCRCWCCKRSEWARRLLDRPDAWRVSEQCRGSCQLFSSLSFCW